MPDLSRQGGQDASVCERTTSAKAVWEWVWRRSDQSEMSEMGAEVSLPSSPACEAHVGCAGGGEGVVPPSLFQGKE